MEQTGLLIVLVTYNRLEYTKRTLKSLLDTISGDFYLVVVDNASSDGTQDWLRKQKELGMINQLILNPKNYYPGKACNMGYEAGLKYFPSANYLMRVDNDLVFYKDWQSKALKYFDKISNLGQLGIDYGVVRKCPKGNFKYTHYNGLIVQSKNIVYIHGLKLIVWPGNVGGPCIIRRELWDKGLRYDERPWYDEGLKTSTQQEDAKLSGDIFAMGYSYATSGVRLAETNWEQTFRDYPDYAMKTLEQRGYLRIYNEVTASNDPEKEYGINVV
jgi:glycosyltransferase involved in cell wall biosynthesis